jgi:hypothetical protein
MRQTRKSTGGTSFHDTVIRASVNELRQVLGPPACDENSGKDKVNFEWEMETEDGDPFTVYDWKEYRRISQDEQIEWHIGGGSRSVTQTALAEITKDMNAPKREAAELILDHLAITPDFETARASALVSAARLKQHYGAKYDIIIKEIKSFNKG